MLSFLPRDVLDEIWDLIESVSEGFLPTLNACGPHPVVAVCRMVPQAAPRGQSHGAALLASSTGRAHQAWSLTDQAGIHRGTIQGQWPAGDHPPVHQAGKCSERRPPMGLSAPRGRPGTTGEGSCVSVLALMAFCKSAGSLLHSELRQQRATASPTLWTVHRRGVASPGHTGARRGVQPASG